MGYLADITKQLSDKQDVIFVGTGIIIKDEFERIFLACRTDNNEWSLPGGSLEVGETLQHCIVRETLEETNIRVKEGDLHLNSAEAILEPVLKNGRKIYVVSVSYWVDVFDDIDLNLDSREFTKYGWFREGEISRLGKITAYSKVALQRYYGGNNGQGDKTNGNNQSTT